MPPSYLPCPRDDGRSCREGKKKACRTDPTSVRQLQEDEAPVLRRRGALGSPYCPQACAFPLCARFLGWSRVPLSCVSQPCEQCVRKKVESTCHYSEPRRRGPKKGWAERLKQARAQSAGCHAKHVCPVPTPLLPPSLEFTAVTLNRAYRLLRSTTGAQGRLCAMGQSLPAVQALAPEHEEVARGQAQ
eukprot:COSAG05_NODE_159_length_15652_cov_14.134636_9_plen_188_part_00